MKGSIAFVLLSFCPFFFVSCAPRVFSRPTGAGVPAPEAPAIFKTATASCATVASDAPTMTLAGGRIDGRGIPSLRVVGALTTRGEIRLDADYNTRPVFAISGTADRAQFVLYPIDSSQPELVTATPNDIIDALLGLKLAPSQLLEVLTGCVSARESPASGERHGKRLALRSGDNVVYLEERNKTWRVAGADLPGMQIDYRAFDGSWPSEVVMVSTSRSAAIRLRIRDHIINSPDLSPATFEIRPVQGARTITLDELRKRFQ